MKDTIKIIFIFFNANYFYSYLHIVMKLKILYKRIKITETILSKSDIFNLYTFLETKYSIYFVPKNINIKIIKQNLYAIT